GNSAATPVRGIFFADTPGSDNVNVSDVLITGITNNSSTGAARGIEIIGGASDSDELVSLGPDTLKNILGAIAEAIMARRLASTTYSNTFINDVTSTVGGNGSATAVVIDNSTLTGSNTVTITLSKISGTSSPGGTAKGISVMGNGQTDVDISENTVQDVQTLPTSNPAAARGIVVDNVQTATITGNQVSGVQTQSATGGEATGVFIHNSPKQVLINNAINMIGLIPGVFQGVINLITTIIDENSPSFGLDRGTSDTVRVDFNTGRVESQNPNITTTCLNLSSPGTVNHVRNNVFANFSPDQTGSNTHSVIVAPANTSLGAPGSFADRNVYHVRNQGNGIVVRGPTQNHTSLAGWRTVSGQDPNSFGHDPQFVSASDLHINPSARSPVSNNAVPITGITTDIDGDPRNPTTPDIGADEGNFTTLLVNDVRPFAFISPVNGQEFGMNSPSHLKHRFQIQAQRISRGSLDASSFRDRLPRPPKCTTRQRH
ncbi:MAG: hypothetical protein AAB393_19450, partial [Bacteroidota bacterium]